MIVGGSKTSFMGLSSARRVLTRTANRVLGKPVEVHTLAGDLAIVLARVADALARPIAADSLTRPPCAAADR
jgi:hypothetical protein